MGEKKQKTSRNFKLKTDRKQPKFDISHIIPTEENGQYSAIDLFCGSGGVTEGFVSSNEIKVVAAVNHSPEAISAHKKNNPDVLHFMEDIREVQKILPHLPTKINILWASAECTNHSNAKGGQSREADSRSLPEYMDAYVSHTNPDAFFVENVREFMDWGPLIHKRDKNGILMYSKAGTAIYCTDKTKKGRYYNRWINSIRKLGYNYDKQLLNSADFGVHTSRTRYFGLFVKKELCLAFPVPTHSKTPQKTGLLPWRACKEKIKLEVEGESIFARALNPNIRQNLRKPLADKSHARCAYGIRKFFLADFISKNFNTKHNVSSLDEPLHNIDTKDRHMKVKLKFLVNLQGSTGERGYSLSGTIPTLTTNPQIKLFSLEETEPKSDLQTKFITQNIQRSLNANSINEPLKTILTQDEKVMITLSHDKKFILKKYAGEKNVGDLNKPYHTIVTEPVDQIITLNQNEVSNFILKKYSGPSNVCSINEPYHSIMTKPDDALISLKQTERPIQADDINELKAKEKREFFFKYFAPDEAELLDLLITDIKARYLTSYELADISGFKPDTYLGKSETIRKKHIGNAVPPKMSKVLSLAFINKNRKKELNVAI